MILDNWKEKLSEKSHQLRQNIQNEIVGEVQKSYLITGKWNFQKRISKSRQK